MCRCVHLADRNTRGYRNDCIHVAIYYKDNQREKQTMKFVPHIIVLIFLCLAEGSRLYEFFKTLSGNEIAGIASAVVTVGIVFYLSFYRYIWASRFSTGICILLSLMSFLHPVKEEYMKEQVVKDKKELLPYPEYDRRAYWNGGKEVYVKSFNIRTQEVSRMNEKIIAHNEKLQIQNELPIFFWHLILGAFILSVGVPILNYLVSHKIAEIFNEEQSKPHEPPRSRKVEKKSGPKETFFSLLKEVDSIKMPKAETQELKPVSNEISQIKKKKKSIEQPSLPFDLAMAM